MEAWDNLDRLYSAEWVQAELQPTYARAPQRGKRVKPWDFLHAVDRRLAERARGEYLAQHTAAADEERKAETAGLLKKGRRPHTGTAGARSTFPAPGP